MWFSSKNKLITLPSECKKLILLNVLFQGGRLFVGAICVLYFLSFGLQTEDYAWIKTTQAVVFIALDIPLGYFLSRLGEYKSLLLSLAFGIIGALGYLISTSFLGFLISETCIALSLSTWPVAFSAYSMRILEKFKTDGVVEKFFHFGDAVSNFSVVICGSLGGLLYAFNKHIPYACFLISYFCAALFALLFLKNCEVRKIEKREKSHFYTIISNIKEMKPIFPFATLLFFAQFLMQPLFHYWQPLFTEKFEIDSKEMSIIFIGYSLAMSTISWGYSRVTHFSFLRSDLFIVGSAILGSLIYSLIARFDAFNYSLIFFALTFGVFNLVQISIGVYIQNRLESKNRMILTKYISFYSRVGMIISLFVLHVLFSNNWKISEVYELYGVLALLIFCLYLGLMIIQKNEKSYVFEPSN